MDFMACVIDAKGKIVGRLASEIAMALMGKQSARYRPNKTPDTKVTVYNTDFVKISGQKSKAKMYYRHSGTIGNLKKESFGHLLKRDSRSIVKRAVSGMLPKNKLRKRQLRNLMLYKSLLPGKK